MRCVATDYQLFIVNYQLFPTFAKHFSKDFKL